MVTALLPGWGFVGSVTIIFKTDRFLGYFLQILKLSKDFFSQRALSLTVANFLHTHSMTACHRESVHIHQFM